eukprot:CAMPEP_0114665982 /NCGR_PEP_ID=MMETSP0191-20121206/31781_1 /TAXON_ID=126664 /ORGANISM="Sorites sp." /LENGTH=42 /DNA_ID= /DNA_START= /DNA_END= /DNA_ORIENTATION=
MKQNLWKEGVHEEGGDQGNSVEGQFREEVLKAWYWHEGQHQV